MAKLPPEPVPAAQAVGGAGDAAAAAAPVEEQTITFSKRSKDRIGEDCMGILRTERCQHGDAAGTQRPTGPEKEHGDTQS